MARLVLILAFTSAGFNFVALKLGSIFYTKTPLFINVALCVPAAALGAASWLMVRNFARAWQVVLCVIVAWVGLLYAFEIEKNRGIVAASYLAMALPIGALIVEHRCWWLCAKVFVFSNAAAMSLALWFEYQTYGVNMATSTFRFGYLVGDNGTYLSNPNVVGGQLAFAALLAFMLHLREGSAGADRRNDPAAPKRFSLGWTVFLSLGCFLTASRGAFLAWFAGIGLVWFWGTRSQESGKLKDLVAISVVLLAVLLFVTVSVGFTPWGSLQKRFEAMPASVLNPTNRFMVWKSAIEAWRSDPQYFLIGTGTGVAPDVLGEFNDYVLPDGITVAAADSHNAFVEWGLSFGLIGMILGTCLMVTMWRRAYQLDRSHGNVGRRAVLLCFCMTSMYYVTFYQLLFVVAGAMILAMLSEPPEAEVQTPQPVSLGPACRLRGSLR